MGTPERPYGELSTEEPVLRDYLAAHRTVLANERTVLAHLRTTTAFLFGGASLIQFFDHVLAQVVGWAFIPVAVIVTAIALRKYLGTRRLLRHIVSARPEMPAEPAGRLSHRTLDGVLY